MGGEVRKHHAEQIGVEAVQREGRPLRGRRDVRSQRGRFGPNITEAEEVGKGFAGRGVRALR